VPVTLRYRDEGRGVVLIASGTVTGAELLAVNDEIYAPERLSVLEYQLTDFSQADAVEISGDEIRRLAAEDARAAREKPGLVVVVVPKTELGFGLSRMWAGNVEVSGARIEPRICRTLQAAEEWLEKHRGRAPEASES
jgi:hypothetical protein